jgi:hypothetical protein
MVDNTKDAKDYNKPSFVVILPEISGLILSDNGSFSVRPKPQS